MKKFSEKTNSAKKKKFKRFGNKQQVHNYYNFIKIQGGNKMKRFSRDNKRNRKKENLRKNNYININKINYKKRRNGGKIVKSKEEEFDLDESFQSNIIQKDEIKERKRDQISSKVPWISIVTKEAVGIVKLHNEINEFYEFIRPKTDQNNLRWETFNMFQDLVNRKYPGWSVELFGSFPLNIHLPNSDIDIMIKPTSIASKDQERDILSMVYIWITGKNFAEKVELVDAKTPIIRMKCIKTNVKMDVCASTDQSGKGHESTLKFATVLKRLPSLRPVILLLKFVLRQRHLNETYTGGVGSYLLLNMIYAYAQYLRKIGEVDKIFNLAQFLLGFLKFYGEEFNYKELGISINNKGEFFRKRDRNIFNNPNLCFENYQDPDIDIGKGAYQFPKVRQIFCEILHTLYRVKVNAESFLTYFINVTTEMMKYNKINNSTPLNSLNIFDSQSNISSNTFSNGFSNFSANNLSNNINLD